MKAKTIMDQEKQTLQLQLKVNNIISEVYICFMLQMSPDTSLDSIIHGYTINGRNAIALSNNNLS